ncbi:hypothetical protein, partial [Escherichia coli]
TIDDCWEGWAILLRQKQKKLIMLPSETMIWQPEFTDKTLSRKTGAVQRKARITGSTAQFPVILAAGCPDRSSRDVRGRIGALQGRITTPGNWR